MNFFANLLKILIIVVLIAAAAVIILMGAMVIFPSFSIFGIHYVSGDSKSTVYYYNINHQDNVAEWANVDTFYVETNNWDVYVYSNTNFKDAHTDNGIDIKVMRNYMGFSNNEVTTAQLSKYMFEERKDGNYLSVYMSEPTGWISKIDSSIYVYLDEDTLKDKNFVIKTNGGKVVLGEAVSNSSHCLNFNSVTLNLGGGLAYIQDVNIADSLIVNKQSGNLSVTKDLTCDVEIDITSGLGNAYLKNIGSETQSNDFVIDNMLNSGIYFDTIYGNALIKANAGLIKGNMITNTVVLEGQNCSLDVGEIGGNLFFDNVDGSISVDKANEVVASITGNGGVNIDYLYGESMFDSVNGSVNISNVYKDIFVNTVNGNIDLNNVEGYTVNYVVESTNGSASIKNIRGTLNFSTNNSGRASLYASYWELKGTNSISTYSGSINIDMLDAGYGFMLSDWSTTNSVYFKLSRFEDFETKDSSSVDKYKDGVRIGGYSGSTDLLSVRSHLGSLRVVHPNLV